MESTSEPTVAQREASLIKALGWSKNKVDQERGRFQHVGFKTFIECLESLARLLVDIERAQFQRSSKYPRLARSQSGRDSKIAAIVIGEKRAIILCSNLPLIDTYYFLLDSEIVLWISEESQQSATNRYYLPYDKLKQTLDIPGYGKGIPIYLLRPVGP
ncbi:MAG TPA: hypothetical protein VG965_03760 [Patescibacteria group bacterium]|nr:hypothetical protein [Patescibacteria group bacterium]